MLTTLLNAPAVAVLCESVIGGGFPPAGTVAVNAPPPLSVKPLPTEPTAFRSSLKPGVTGATLAMKKPAVAAASPTRRAASVKVVGNDPACAT